MLCKHLALTGGVSFDTLKTSGVCARPAARCFPGVASLFSQRCKPCVRAYSQRA